MASALINIMERAARKASRGLIRDFGEVAQLQVSRKGPANFVSAADHRAEEILRRELLHARPHYGFLGEETGSTGSKLPRWIVDPLDGTTNFLHSLPHFAIAIALEQAEGIMAGLVLDPIAGEFFYAEKGAGAFLNNQRLRVSSRTRLQDALFATGYPRPCPTETELSFKELHTLVEKSAGLRRTGSAALDLAYVAAGRLDGCWDHNLQPWDIAAGMILVREAGGLVGGLKEGEDALETGNIIAAPPGLYAPLRSLLAAS